MESILQDFFTNITQRIESLEKNYMKLFDERLQIAGFASRLKVVEDDVRKVKVQISVPMTGKSYMADANNNNISKSADNGNKISPSKVIKLITNNASSSVSVASPVNQTIRPNNNPPSLYPRPTNLPRSMAPKPAPKPVEEKVVTPEKDVITPDDMDLTSNDDDLVEKDEDKQNKEAEASWDSVEAIEGTVFDDDISLSDVDEPHFPQEDSSSQNNVKTKSSIDDGSSECQDGNDANDMSFAENDPLASPPPIITPFPLYVKNEVDTTTNTQTQHLATRIAKRERSKESATVEESSITETRQQKPIRTRNSKDGYFWNQCYVKCLVCSKKVCPGWNGYGEDLDKAIIWHAQKAHKVKEQEARNWGKTMFVHTCLICNKKLAFMLNPIITHINEAHDMALKKYEDQFCDQLDSIFNELSEDKSMPKSLLQAKAQRQQMREKVIDID